MAIKNWEISVGKWKRMVKYLESMLKYGNFSKADLQFQIRQPCGHCTEYVRTGADDCKKKCHLFPDFCSIDFTSYAAYWKVRTALDEGNWEAALDGSRRILAEILKHKEDFREKKKK